MIPFIYIWYGEDLWCSMMLNDVQNHNPSDFSFKVRPIVKDDLLWHSKSTNDVVLYE